MADTDNSSPILRYNLITQGVEYFQGSDFYPIATAPDQGITQLTGDVTAGPGNGSQAATLKTVNTNVGSFTLANITVNAKGLITAASNGSASGATVQSYAPTIVGCGTPTGVSFFYKSDGVSVEVWGTFIAGTTTAATYSISTPVTIHGAHLSTNSSLLGTENILDDGSNPSIIFYDGSDTANVYGALLSAGSIGNPYQKFLANAVIETGVYVSMHFSYPIA